MFLIRHGQYNSKGNTDTERTLTELGREQAFEAAQRLRQLNLPYSLIVQSTMTRATETAQIISKQFPHLPVASCDLLREGVPFAPEPPTSHAHEDDRRVFIFIVLLFYLFFKKKFCILSFLKNGYL